MQISKHKVSRGAHCLAVALTKQYVTIRTTTVVAPWCVVTELAAKTVSFTFVNIFTSSSVDGTQSESRSTLTVVALLCVDAQLLTPSVVVATVGSF
jgi:hypothetical protein